MDKDTVFTAINNKFEELKKTLEGDDPELIRELTLELHAMVHPAEISGRKEKTVADFGGRRRDNGLPLGMAVGFLGKTDHRRHDPDTDDIASYDAFANKRGVHFERRKECFITEVCVTSPIRF